MTDQSVPAEVAHDLAALERMKMMRENEKLEHEVKALKAPWFKKSGYLALAASLIIALGPMTFDSWAGLRDSREENKLLKREARIARLDMQDAIKAATQAATAIDALRLERIEIEKQRTDLLQESIALKAEKESLEAQVSALEEDKRAAQAQIAAYAEKRAEEKRKADAALRQASLADKERLEREAREAEAKAEAAAKLQREAKMRANEAAAEKQLRATLQRESQAARDLKVVKDIEQLNAEAAARLRDSQDWIEKVSPFWTRRP